MRQTILAALSPIVFGCTVALSHPAHLVAGSIIASEKVQESLVGLALAEAALGEAPTEEAVRSLEAAYRDLLRRHPDQPKVRNACAAFLFDHGSPDEALALWRETLEQEPENAEAAFQIGHALLQHGTVPIALDYLRRAAASPAATAFQIYSFANALYLFRREAGAETPEAALEQALAEFARAARLDPGSLEYARGYAETFFALKEPDWSQALPAWQRVVELTPESNPSKNFYLLQAARAALEAGEPETANAFLDKLRRESAGGAEKKLRARVEEALREKAER